VKRVVLDVRELEHPVPLGMAAQAFKEADENTVIIMIHRKNPLPLFQILEKNGGRYLSRQVEEKLFHIFITRHPTLKLENIDV